MKELSAWPENALRWKIQAMRRFNRSGFYQNRATALVSLGRPLEAAQDLQTYLHLQPNSEDRVQVEAQLAQLQAPIFPQ